MRQISLNIHLRFLALGRGGQRDNAEHPRADSLGNRLDRASLAGAVAPLEHDADLQSLVLDPLLQLDQLDVQVEQLALVVFRLELLARHGMRLARFMLVVAHDVGSVGQAFQPDKHTAGACSVLLTLRREEAVELIQSPPKPFITAERDEYTVRLESLTYCAGGGVWPACCGSGSRTSSHCCVCPSAKWTSTGAVSCVRL